MKLVLGGQIGTFVTASLPACRANEERHVCYLSHVNLYPGMPIRVSEYHGQ